VCSLIELLSTKRPQVARRLTWPKFKFKVIFFLRYLMGGHNLRFSRRGWTLLILTTQAAIQNAGERRAGGLPDGKFSNQTFG
jgi:hypothetical protein